MSVVAVGVLRTTCPSPGLVAEKAPQSPDGPKTVKVTLPGFPAVIGKSEADPTGARAPTDSTASSLDCAVRASALVVTTMSVEAPAAIGVRSA